MVESDVSKNGGVENSPMVNPSTKATNTLAKTVKSKFFVSLDTNGKLAVIR